MPDISKITLPSGNSYDIKDATARQMISGGISYIIAWDGTSTPQVADIPAGVVVKYNNVTYTGTLSADSAEAGAFYLVKSSSNPSSETLDIYDEYVPIGTTGSKTWEKLGDTQLNLSDVVTDVELSKSTTNFVTGYSSPTTDSVIGADATFTVTQPTITVTPTTTNVKATATGANTAWNSKDLKSVVTGYAAPTTDTFVKSVTAETGKNLVTTTITGVGGTVSLRGVAGTTSVSKASAAASQTTATGAGTATTTNTDWLKGVSVSNETLIIGAATLNTQTTTQFTFSNVTVATANASSTSVAVASSTETTVATGATDATGAGDPVVTGVTIGTTASAITGLGTPTTASVVGSSATFTITQPTVALASGATTGAGVLNLATGISSASATGANVAWNNKDAVSAVTGLGTPSTSAGLNDSTSINVTKGNA